MRHASLLHTLATAGLFTGLFTDLFLGDPSLISDASAATAGHALAVSVDDFKYIDTSNEPIDQTLKYFYDRLLNVLCRPVAREGHWRLLECTPAWEGNWSSDAFIAYAWGSPSGGRLVVTVNYAPHPSQCYVQLASPDLGGCRWRLTDLLGDARYDRSGDDLVTRGLYLDVPPWSYHVFEMIRL